MAKRRKCTAELQNKIEDAVRYYCDFALRHEIDEYLDANGVYITEDSLGYCLQKMKKAKKLYVKKRGRISRWSREGY